MKLYMVDNRCMMDFLEMYCMGKSFLWNAFFGWRRSTHYDNDIARCYYRVPKKVYEMAERLAHDWDEFEIVNG